jgi:hypothetical protein
VSVAQQLPGVAVLSVVRRFAVAVGLVMACTCTLPAQAASTDTTGPHLVVSSTPYILLGQNFPDADDVDGSLEFWTAGAAFEYRWTASDPSDICRYSVDEHIGPDEWIDGVQDDRTNATSGQFGFTADGRENSDDMDVVRINAYDCAGNVTSVERGGAGPHLFADYGDVVPSGWARTSCTCAIGDSMLRTSTKNASLSTAVRANGYTSRVALIMAKGPARGRAAAYWDGRLVKTVDTYARASSNRVVMWDVEVKGTARHTIRVVNLGTSGRPRIDVDAYVIG